MLFKTTCTIVGVSFLWMYFQLKRENLNDQEKLAYLDVPDIIKHFGYMVEEHFVITPDGYHLAIHRIPRHRNTMPYKGTVFIQHGLLQSSADFVMMGPEQSLGFLLAKAGYDVWMGNHRGNYYSNKHETFSVDKSEFWNFTVHEIGIDIGSIIDYILDYTNNEKLGYVGFSIGGTSPVILLSERPEYNAKIKIAILLAPAAYPSQILTFFTKNMFLGVHIYKNIFDYIGVKSVLQRNLIYADIARVFCPEGGLLQSFCYNFASLISGSSESNIDGKFLPVIIGHTPSGSSRYALEHVGQIILSGEFQKYDYGEGNKYRYGRESPTAYNFKNFKTNVVFMCGTEDHISPCVMVERVYSQLSNVLNKNLYILENTTHFDFIYGSNARKQIYDGIIQILDKYS